MQAEQLFDPVSAAIVVGGTLIATVLRCGMEDTRAAIGAIGGLWQRRFDAARARAALATQVREIQQEGLLRAEPRRSGDPEFDEATDALIGKRSLAALQAAHEAHRRRRIERNMQAVQTLIQAADLAPVFGLAGTLISLSQLPRIGSTAEAFMGAISMAVLTTLYGLLLGNLFFAPLARIVDRAARAEERERQKLVDWLEEQVTPAIPGARPLAVAAE
ncbi:MotA/TolQ/ExbB proton channel family protein [Novosphingobium album (ex Liu et al. 2023)]|uniref:MotA/TolQ/ExbB proton channel family protein n=1 Tax=Novosphingobium album (ex Liu et al. 2023) TaxID=3031130 RepID=A0ABT5WM78_9SPHN|nr:MotA/TolQ/ExbB proton channel family protein [Novosphingobium album (ex Liu et al. 2023)]MDE8651154.1 MotA/TolQ/ExbB proton channel family protein [Novosphingobium album (ex Liu et al. 2023)]